MSKIAGKPDICPWSVCWKTYTTYEDFMIQTYGEEVFYDDLMRNLRKMVKERNKPNKQ